MMAHLVVAFIALIDEVRNHRSTIAITIIQRLKVAVQTSDVGNASPQAAWLMVEVL